MKKIFFWIPILLAILSCNGQTNDKNHRMKSEMTEKFDLELYERFRRSDTALTLPNGNTLLAMIAPQKNENGAQQELLSNPFLICHKEFYPNGLLKQKEIRLSETVKVMQSEYYDERGQLQRKINEDAKYGKISYQEILEFLHKKGYIDIAKGTGRLDKDGTPKYDVLYDARGNYWTIILFQGKKLSDDEFAALAAQTRGEPNSWMSIYYRMDGHTGDVKEVQNLPNSK